MPVREALGEGAKACPAEEWAAIAPHPTPCLWKKLSVSAKLQKISVIITFLWSRQGHSPSGIIPLAEKVSLREGMWLS